jgi:hypothetical protein
VLVVAPFLTSNFTMFGLGTLPLTHDQIELPRVVFVHLAAWIGLATWALSVALSGTAVRAHKALWALGAFLAIAGVSSLASPYQFTAFFGEYRHYEGFFALLAYAALAFVAMQLANGRRLTWLVRLATVTGTLLALYGIAQTLKLDRTRWLSNVLPGRAFATWGNPDFFAGYLLFPLAFSIALAFGERNSWWRLLGVVGAVTTLAALVSTATRGAWIAGACLLVVMFVGLVRKGFPWKLLSVVTAGVVVASGVAFNYASKGELLNRIVTVFTSAEAGVSYQRFGIWGKAVELLGRQWLLGTGPDTVAPASRMAFNYSFSNDAHNYPLQSALTVGIFGAIALFAFLLWSAWSSRSVAFSDKDDLPNLALTGAWAACLGYLVHLLVGMSMVTSTAMLFVCVGVLLGASCGESAVVPTVVSGIVVVLASALLLATFGFGGRAIAADRAYLLARAAARYGGPRIAYAERAVRLHPFNATYDLELRSAIRAEGQ